VLKTRDSSPPLDEEAALDWLRNESEVETTITALAKVWGWDRSRASRALDRWRLAGLITRRPGSDRKTVFFAPPAIPPVNASSPAVSRVAQQIDGTTDISAGPAVPPMHASIPAAHAVATTGEVSGGPAALPVQAAGMTVRTVAQPDARPTRPLRNVLSNGMFFVAFGLGSVGLAMNARFAASFGRSDEAALILATIGALIDVLVAMLPSVGCHLWRSGRRMACGAAWCLWLFTAGMSLLAGAGFTATNLGDTIADRDRIVHEVTGVRATVDRLRAERTAITEIRSTAVLQAQSERERALVDRNVWKATRSCHDVTIPDSAAACTAVMTTRQAMAVAARRDAVEAELRAAQEKLAALPAIQATADPQAEMAAKIIDLISIGRVAPEPQHIARLRTAGLAVMPTLAGIVMMLGMALRRGSAAW
jgi:hypothetical protein